MRYIRSMDRAAVQRYFAGFEKAAAAQRRLEVDEARDLDAVVARSLSLCEAMLATLPPDELRIQASAGDEGVRETWATLRRKALR